MAPASGKDRPLRSLAEEFQKLACEFEKVGNRELQLEPFAHACSRISILLGCLGIAFKFAEKDYVTKIQHLLEASKQHKTVESLLDHNLYDGSTTDADNLVRSALYVTRGVDMVKVLCERLVDERESFLRECAAKAYEDVFSANHSWPIRKAVAAGMYTLPTKAQFLKKIHEDETSAMGQMQLYIRAAVPITQHIHYLYTVRSISLDL